MELAKKVGNNVKEIRKLNGLTQKQVAAKFYMTQQQYSRFENGVFEFNYSQIVGLCKLLGTTPNEIFGYDY